jgi:RNA polymerase sigma-70 factor (ECF subfamily)
MKRWRHFLLPFFEAPGAKIRAQNRDRQASLTSFSRSPVEIGSSEKWLWPLMRTQLKSSDPWGQFDSRFRAPLMSYFMRRVSDRAVAEDLTQDVFEKLLKASRRSGIKDVEALVFVTAGNLLKDFARKARRRGSAQLQDIDAANVSVVTREFLEDCNPERVLLGRETVRDVLEALDELGPRTRGVYVLFKLEGMKQAEIAKLLGIGQSTVEKDVMRATANLTLRFGRRP